MKLTDALHMAPDEVVALVRLAREVVEGGGRAITTTTTRIFGAQIALAPAHVPAASVTRERLAAELALHRHVLVIGATDADSGKAEGISLDLFRHVRAWFPDVCLLNEADGSRMRPFKAPADYEPVIPADTTLVAVVVGADVLGRSLDAEHVHRPELVATLSGAPMGAPVTPAIVARVLADPQGGRKGVPAGARVVVLINKVEGLPDRAPARETAERLLRDPAIHSVVLATLRAEDPVLEVCAR